MESVVSSSLKNLKLSSTSIQGAAREEERSEEEEKAPSDRPPADEQGAKTPCNNIQHRDPFYFFGDLWEEEEIIVKGYDEEEDELEEIHDDEEEVAFVSEPPPPKLPATQCRFCPGFHSPDDNCNGDYCQACNSKEHYHFCCPFLKELPRDAYFNPVNFEIRCRCGCPFFDKDKWVCPSVYCGFSRPVLALKKCDTCRSLEFDHTSYDCPKDKDSARFKAKMLIYYLED